MFGGIVLMPVQIQLVLGISPGSTGLIMIPLMSGTVIGSFIAGRIMRRTGRYKMDSAGRHRRRNHGIRAARNDRRRLRRRSWC